MSSERQEQLRSGIVDSPVYWFSRFESAILKNDHDEARVAQERLKRLGYSVAYLHVGDAKGGE
jgi:hypothetical protein